MPRIFGIHAALAAALYGLAPWASPALSAQTHSRPAVEADAPIPLRQWGEESLEVIERDLRLRGRDLYAEKSMVNQPPTEPAFMWGAGVQLSALAAAAQAEPRRYTASLRTFADALQVYWTEHDGIGGFDVLPAPKPADRYYDDNVWVVLALAETFEVTHDAKYRERAEAAFRFVMSGEDDRLGGGIYWRENTRDSKNTCSNAPAIVAALRLYQITGRREYLETARRLYDWTRARLQDPADGLFWDNVKLDGEIDRRKYSYNSALMIRANALLHSLTSEPHYLAEARRIARSAESKWVDPATGGISDGGRFAHLLLESFLALDRQEPDPRWRKIVRNALVFVHERVRDSNGHYANRWNRPQSTPLKEFTLIDQASAARAYWMASLRLRASMNEGRGSSARALPFDLPPRSR